MFTTLLEARAGRSRSRGGAVVSFVAHVAAVTLAVVATQNDVGATQDPPRTETITVYRPDPPPPPPVAAPAAAAPVVEAPRAPRIRLVVVAPVEIPNVLPVINIAAPVTPDIDRSSWRPAGNATSSGTGRRSGLGATVTDVYTIDQVDKPALQIAGLGVPVYPELLKDAGIGGNVVVAFVIDTAGRAESGTLRVLRSTRPEFLKSVAEALPRMRFLPAQAGGRKVRQLVELPFHFTVR